MLRKQLAGWAEGIEIVAVNDIVSIENLAYLLKYDSVHGRLPWEIVVDGDHLVIGDHRIRCLNVAAPVDLPWSELGVDAVIEATGQFTTRDAAAGHLQAGARRVLIGAPAADADVTLVMGVNDADFDPERHTVVSNASCTTNSLLPVLAVLAREFGLETVAVTTIHAVTASQTVVDKPAKKMHRGRAAGVSMIPTTTGADKAAHLVMPELKGRIAAIAVRVPVPDGSVTDISALLEREASAAEINAELRRAAEGELAGVLGYSEDELVSADILGEPYSGLVHANSTRVAGRLAKVLVWYDNETGYACRCLDVVAGRF